MSAASSDITAVIMRLPQHVILLISVYVQCADPEALREIVSKINNVVRKEKQRISNLKIIIAGDFNHHNYLWGGNGVTEERQGEATPIINMMAEHGLTSLLKTGTVTREQADIKLTIDLTLATQNITNSTIFCKVHEVKHGSDHIAIESFFDLSSHKRAHTDRLLFKKAPWQRIQEITTELLRTTPQGSTAQEKCD